MASLGWGLISEEASGLVIGNHPTRSPKRGFGDHPPRFGEGCSRPDLARAVHDIFEGRELLDAHRPAGMEAPGGDADLSPHAELAAVGELRGGIVQHDGAVDAREEFLGRRPCPR